MKSIIFPSVAAVLFFASCGNNALDEKKEKIRKSQEEAQERQADEELLKKAQGIFKALPGDASDELHVLSEEKVNLGYHLYYDTRLSLTGNNSCNSCHDLSKYGVDNLPTSPGDAGKNGDRNSPTVLNAALHTMQFWDGRAKDVEEQAGMPILNPVEMAIPSKDFLVKKLKGVKEYVSMFSAAFPNESDPLTYANIQNAIAAFERKLITPSRFDNFMNGDLTALNKQEKNGLKLFMETGCTTCHNGALLGGNMFQKFGIGIDYRSLTHSVKNDDGRMAVTKVETDKDIFKVPSLRNVEKTAPYFHDGSVASLEKSIEIMAKAELGKELKKEEVADLVAFLSTLTGTVPAQYTKAPEGIILK